ncbi:hypothetical protein CBR_g19107 [Chara braunii]|uniref:ethanolamine kinase n=1 Tax=Chara braunii TaxID=69332 RepID=A0A388KXJ7_CHABU|nr:hypothetical protein CBR_g19107 [Chara braunii]|eukprot:GBG74702.1 hypothetical protein CBR_g19107 [Chara braunii]
MGVGVDSVLDISAPQEELHAGVKEVCQSIVIGWREVDPSRLVVSTISGGITNILLKVSKVEFNGEEVVEESSVIVRIFGKNTELFIARPRELENTKVLSAHGFGPKFLGAFGNGLVQSFIHARTLDVADMSKGAFVVKIARLVRRFNDLHVPGSREPQLWTGIEKLLMLAKQISFDDDPVKQQRFSTISLSEIRTETADLKTACESLQSPVVFCHNDLLSGNFMYDDEKDELHVIDFEYGDYNYRGYEIGNHFNEYAGFDCDYTLYPSKEAQWFFIKHYLCPDSPEDAQESEIERLYVEANVFALASHIYWGVWALLQASFSSVDFDYLGYFFMRWDEYKRRKDEAFALIKGKGKDKDKKGAHSEKPGLLSAALPHDNHQALLTTSHTEVQFQIPIQGPVPLLVPPVLSVPLPVVPISASVFAFWFLFPCQPQSFCPVSSSMAEVTVRRNIDRGRSGSLAHGTASVHRNWVHTSELPPDIGTGSIQLELVPYNWNWFHTIGTGSVHRNWSQTSELVPYNRKLVPYNQNWFHKIGTGSVHWNWSQTSELVLDIGTGSGLWNWFRTSELVRDIIHPPPQIRRADGELVIMRVFFFHVRFRPDLSHLTDQSHGSGVMHQRRRARSGRTGDSHRTAYGLTERTAFMATWAIIMAKELVDDIATMVMICRLWF